MCMCICATLLLADRDAHIMHKELGFLYLNKRSLHFCFPSHKTICSEGCTSLKQFYVPIVPTVSRLTRGQLPHNMEEPNIHSELGHKAISWRGPLCWNKLPNVAKCTDKFVEFKRYDSAKVYDLFGDHSVKKYLTFRGGYCDAQWCMLSL